MKIVKYFPSKTKAATDLNWPEVFDGQIRRFGKAEQKPTPKQFRRMIRNKAHNLGIRVRVEAHGDTTYVQAIMEQYET